MIVGDQGSGTINIISIQNPGNVSARMDSQKSIILGKEATGSGLLNIGDRGILNIAGNIVHGDGKGLIKISSAGNINFTGANRTAYVNVDTQLLGDGANAGELSVALASSSLVVDGKISDSSGGKGGIGLTGQGVIEINNKDNDYTGKTVRSSSGSKTSVLEGVGTIGGDLKIVDGIFRPGVSNYHGEQYGRMDVKGNTVMDSGTTLEANLGSYPASSGVDDKGSFTIKDKSTLKLDIANDAYLKVGEAYTIVKADGGVDGKFSQVAGDTLTKLGDTKSATGYAMLNSDPQVIYDKNDVKVSIDRNGNADFGTGALTRDERASGHGLNALANAGKDEGLLNSIAGIDNEQRIRALDTLSGQINADQKTAMVNDAYYIRDMLIKRMDCIVSEVRRKMNDKDSSKGAGAGSYDPKHKISTWGAMFGSRGNSSGYKGYDSATNLGQSSAGWIMGADTQVGRWRVGGTVAYGRDWFSAAGTQMSHAHSNNVTLGGYGATSWRVGGINPDARVTFKAGATYTWDMIHSDRNVKFNGYDGHNSSSNLGGTGQVFGETGYKFNAGNWEFEPFTRMTYVNYNHGGYHEHGSSSALAVKGRDSSIGYSTTGIKLATIWGKGKFTVSPHAQLAYRYGFGSLHSVAKERFMAQGGGSYNMNTIGVPLAKNTALTDFGFTMGMGQRLSVSLDYIGQYGLHETSSGGTGSFKLRF